LLGSNGEILYNGEVAENAEAFMPRDDKNLASVKTDIFALGSTIYHIVKGHRPFSELIAIDDEDEIWRASWRGYQNVLAGRIHLC
jgi:hypothetical protein